MIQSMKWYKRGRSWLERVIFHRFHQKPVTKELSAKELIKGSTGPLTACEALELVVKYARKVDPAFKLNQVRCDHLDLQGRGWVWYFSFDFPSRIAVGDFTLSPCDSTSQAITQPVCLRTVVRSKAAERIVDLLNQFKNDPATLSYLSNVYIQREDGRLYLPLNFRDSPQVIETLAAQGADLARDRPEISLSTGVFPGGEIVWLMNAAGREYRVSFLQESRIRY